MEVDGYIFAVLGNLECGASGLLEAVTIIYMLQNRLFDGKQMVFIMMYEQCVPAFFRCFFIFSCQRDGERGERSGVSQLPSAFD